MTFSSSTWPRTSKGPSWVISPTGRCHWGGCGWLSTGEAAPPGVLGSTPAGLPAAGDAAGFRSGGDGELPTAGLGSVFWAGSSFGKLGSEGAGVFAGSDSNKAIREGGTAGLPPAGHEEDDNDPPTIGQVGWDGAVLEDSGRIGPLSIEGVGPDIGVLRTEEGRGLLDSETLASGCFISGTGTIALDGIGPASWTSVGFGNAPIIGRLGIRTGCITTGIRLAEGSSPIKRSAASFSAPGDPLFSEGLSEGVFPAIACGLDSKGFGKEVG